MEGSPWGPLAALGVKAGASWNDAHHLCTCPRSSSTPPSRWLGIKKARCLGSRQGSAKVAFSTPAPLAGAWFGTWQWLWGRGLCTRAHVGQDRVSGEPCTGLRVALVLDLKGYSLSQVSRRSGAMAGEAGGVSLRGAGLPGVRGPVSASGPVLGAVRRESHRRGRGPFFLPGQGQDGSWAGLCFLLAFTWDRWPRAPPGGPEQGWESLSSRSSQPALGRGGVGELEGGVDGPPTVGTGAWALIPALPEHLVEETPAIGWGLASLPSAVEKGSPGSWERRAELWGLVGSGQSQPGH